MDILSGIIVKELIEQLLPIAVTVASGLVSAAVVYVRRYVLDKIKVDKTRLALESLTAVTEAVVGELAQTARTYAKDGLTKEEATRLKLMAYDRIAGHLPNGAGKLLEALVGDVGDLILSKIESQVLRTKADQARVQMARECGSPGPAEEKPAS
jgi:hypothetical protein